MGGVGGGHLLEDRLAVTKEHRGRPAERIRVFRDGVFFGSTDDAGMHSANAQVHIDEESVAVFVPDSEARVVVVAMLDEAGRPSNIVRWNPEQHRFDAPSGNVDLEQ